MTSKWPVVPLGELIETLGGLWTGKNEPFVKATVIRSTNFGKGQRLDLQDAAVLDVEASQFGKRELQYGDLVLEKSGGGPNQPVGRVVVFDRNETGYSYSNFTNRLRILDRERVLPEYLHQFLTHFHLRGGTESIQSNSTSIRNLSMPDYLRVEIPLPSLDEQKRIVAKLDEAMELLGKIAIRQSTKEMEVERFATSVLTGLIPPTENLISLMEVCDFKGGAQPPKSTFVDKPQNGYVRFVQIRDFESDAHIVYIPESANNRTCLESDVLVGRYGASVGRICRGLTGAYNVALMKVVPDTSQVTTDFLEIFLKSDFFQKPLLELSIRSAQSGFNKDDLATIQIPKVSLDEQAIIIEKYRVANGLVSDIKARSRLKVASTGQVKNSILYAAFAGEL